MHHSAHKQGSGRGSDIERLRRFCPDLADWPESWSFDPRDIAPGCRIVERFTPFLLHLLDLGLSPKTLRRHRENLWALGGELIRALHGDPALRGRPIAELLARAIDEEGGPLLPGASEHEQRAFDTTCRRFYRFFLAADTPPR